MVVGRSGDYRYGYQGQYAEKDPETDWSSFELRMYDSRIARWLSVDPYGEFWSPYLGMGNDPVNNVDPDGGCSNPECRAKEFSNSQSGSFVYELANGKWVVVYHKDNRPYSQIFDYQATDFWSNNFSWMADLGFSTGWNSNIRINNYVKVMEKAKVAFDAGRITLSEASLLRYQTLVKSREQLTLTGKWMSQLFKSNAKAYKDYLRYISSETQKLSVFTPNPMWTKVARVGKVAGPLLTFLAEGMEYNSIITEKKTIEQVEEDYANISNPMLLGWMKIENWLKSLSPTGPIKPISTSGNK